MTITFNRFLPLTLGILTGFIGGVQASNILKKNTQLTPQQILENIKNSFQNEIPIQDSWIAVQTKQIRKFALTTEVYQGGVSRIEDNQLVRYEFQADAKTGSVLSLNRIDA
ncbi:hypothetical protein [Liquorilactobacillus cacaonum]|uniref:PepSY domain-containing protein n=1 Tax=Liquorilactobacillus cacaonum DSM 21116 TaxID=1423729 RepID=A0A0R2CQL2_9LACO|nr:hypothetical protein [Liquorilactobacillus cacaonum]KRM90603.1 hypothetical protein FC80_GL000592 [Liquorilactobacillus cacaonum DSM 21116]